MFGKGLLQGLKITLGWFFKPKVTVQYPEQRLPLPERFIGKPKFDYDKCTACNQCVMACPNQVIKLNTETVDKKRILTQYDFNQQYCMFCGMCEEACPKDAIKFTKDFELTQYNRPDIKIQFVKPEHIEKKRIEIKKLMQEQTEKALKEAAQKEVKEDPEKADKPLKSERPENDIPAETELENKTNGIKADKLDKNEDAKTAMTEKEVTEEKVTIEDKVATGEKVTTDRKTEGE